MSRVRARSTCPTCEGRGRVDPHNPDAPALRVPCDECAGRGHVEATAATDALGHIVGDAIVARLEEHQDAVVAWLAELGTLRPAQGVHGYRGSWALEFMPRNPDLGNWQRDYVAPGTTRCVPYDDKKADPLRHRRLYTVEVD